jgi:PAS domain S-box-containing protein
MNKYSSVKVRETGKNMKVLISSEIAPEIEERMIIKWQNWLDIIARLAKIPAALIMKLNEETIEVFLKSNTANNPYTKQEKVKLGCGLYCENVIGTNQKLLISDATENLTWNINNPDLDLNMISYLGYPLNWPDGKIFGTICILDNKENQFSKDLDDLLFNMKQSIESDLELLLSKQTLLESEEKFKSLFNLLPLPAVFTDYESSRIIDFNNKLLELTGFTKDELLHKTAVSLGLVDQSFRNNILSVIHNKGLAGGVEVSFPTPKNGIMHFLLSSTKFNLKGEEKLISTLLDVTQNKKQMEILKESEKKLSKLIATKNKFFSIIAHDLMDPFNTLLGFSHILTEAIINDEKKESQEYANYITQAAQKIFNLLQNLLIWSRTQSGNINLNPALVNMDDLIHNSVKLLELRAKNKKIAIRIITEKNLKAFLDVNMISTVIRNLAMNAVKFTENGGSVTIKAKSINNGINISVADTGTGIEKKQLKYLFSLEKSNHFKGTNDETGTGLGLIICKEFVTLHNGKIRVKSEPGKGSKFQFWIPDRLNELAS